MTSKPTDSPMGATS